MQEFLAHHIERKLRHNGSLVDSIYSNDALSEKAPLTIPQLDRISIFIGEIKEEKWQIALAIQNSNTVERLIDRATALDTIRNNIVFQMILLFTRGLMNSSKLLTMK
ncbi:uncharacterized protein TNCV_4220811 [Trichonephila clavipes]|nr:uncharacterized protein TNCV_4220811 [Trichonephila clavipes]